MENEIQLTPAQRSAAEDLLGSLRHGSVFVLKSKPGMGRSTVLRFVNDSVGGVFIGIRDFIERLKDRHPQAIEETFFELIERALDHHEVVVMDDLHLLTEMTGSFRYPRAGLLQAVLVALMEGACASNRKLVFGEEGDVLLSMQGRSQTHEIADFAASDYEALCRGYLSAEVAGRLDYAHVHRFASSLNAWQLKSACLALAGDEALDTDGFIEHLRSRKIESNVELEEVQPVDWRDLKGMDDVIEALETKIALPFENHELAAALRLKPRRGVLLAGPPGTGKTTIGRALAHRLKGKFFLIDGTVVAGSCDFFEDLNRIFESAKKNAPSVVFIDDTDVIFEGKEERSFYRYLLTMLDGLESASAERVCVMMTAMDVASLPPALVRSGRIELWLETRLPDLNARGVIVSGILSRVPPPLGSADVDAIASASHGLTGADLKSILEDGKLLFARDLSEGRPLQPAEDYFLAAIETVRTNRRGYGRKKPAPFAEVVKMGFAVESST